MHHKKIRAPGKQKKRAKRAKRPIHKPFALIYSLGFLWALTAALPAYMNSSFLQQFLHVEKLGFYYAFLMVVTLFFVSIFPHWIKRFTNYRLLQMLLPVNILSLLVLAAGSSTAVILIAYLLYYVTLYLTAINLDVFLENISDNETTGKTRTGFMTVKNVAWVISPFIMGQLVGGDRFWLVYVLVAFLSALLFLVSLTNGHKVKDHVLYNDRTLPQMWGIFRRNRNLGRIFELGFALRVFYAVLVLYIPIHLHDNLGFGWAELGLMFTIMLIPFVIIQFPAGTLADRILGEKELMVLGLFVMMVSTGLMFFVESRSFFVWASILFVSRVGAALLEAMTEVYFFKTVGKKDVDLIHLFRDMGPAGWLIGSLLSAALLQVLPLPFVFLLVVFVLLLSMRPALLLQDTR